MDELRKSSRTASQINSQSNNHLGQPAISACHRVATTTCSVANESFEIEYSQSVRMHLRVSTGRQWDTTETRCAHRYAETALTSRSAQS